MHEIWDLPKVSVQTLNVMFMVYADVLWVGGFDVMFDLRSVNPDY